MPDIVTGMYINRFLTTAAINETEAPAPTKEKYITSRLGQPVVNKNEIIFYNSEYKDFVLSHDNGMLMDKETMERNVKWATSLMTVFNKFYDEKSKKIPKEKIFDIGTEIDARYTPYRGGRGGVINWNQVLRNALSDMTNPNSDGEADITEKEIYGFYERCARIISKDSDSYFSLRKK